MFKNFKFRFNAAARKEAVKGLQKMGSVGSPVGLLLANLLFTNAGDRLVLSIVAAANYVVCNALVVWVAGLEDSSTKKRSTPPSKTDDTS
jgi:hypothetical protein